MKKYFVILLAFCTLLNTIVIPNTVCAAETSVTNDNRFDEAADTLYNLGLTGETESQPGDKLTRAEFADLLVTVLGLKNDVQSEDAETKKFLGYTNDPVYEDVEGWIWNGDSSSDENENSNAGNTVKINENATAFRDVLSTDTYWDSIKIAASYGFMSGDENRYFRPKDKIKLIEAEKVLLYSAGRAPIMGSDFPNSVIKEAAKTRITAGVNAAGINEYITYRDAVVMIYNALDINVPETSYYSNGDGRYEISKDETVLSYYRGIYSTDGVVTKTKYTTVTSPKGTERDTIFIDNTEYNTSGADYEEYLGKKVKLYYKTENRNDSRCTVCLLKDLGSRELIIDAEDIKEYKNNRLTYYTKSGKLSSEYIGSGVNIVYNGKALTEYTKYGDDIITPTRGNVRFLDTSGNGSYDTVFINSIRTAVVSAADGDNERIYDRLNTKDSIDLKNSDCIITDSNGLALGFADIGINSVLDVKSTLSTQGSPLVRITVNNKEVTGKITSRSQKDKSVKIDGNEYKYSSDFDESLVDMNSVMTFYLNSDDEIVWAKKGTGLTFAFLTALADDGAFDSEIKIRIYDFAADEFKVYDLADKVIVNKTSKIDAEDIKSSILWDSAADTTASQVIKLRLNSGGEVVEIMTEKNADGTLVDENEMVEVPFTPCDDGLMVRVGVKMLEDAHAPVAYYDSNTVYCATPLKNFSDDTAYYKGDDFVEGRVIKANKMYKSKKSSAIAALVLRQEDTGGLGLDEKQRVDNYAPALITDISETLSEDGETCYEISGINMNSGTFTNKVTDKDLMKLVETFEPGDMINYKVSGQYNYIQRMKKVFDGKDNAWTTRYGGGNVNPVNDRTDYFDGKTQAIHGRVTEKLDDGEFIRITPYAYNDSGNTGVLDTESVYACIYPTKYFKYYVYDRERGQIRMADVGLDLISEEEAQGAGSEVIAWTCYGQAKTVIIFK